MEIIALKPYIRSVLVFAVPEGLTGKAELRNHLLDTFLLFAQVSHSFDFFMTFLCLTPLHPEDSFTCHCPDPTRSYNNGPAPNRAKHALSPSREQRLKTHMR